VTSSEGEEHRERIAESAVCPKKTLPEAWQYLHTREAASSKEGKKKREGERMRDKSYYHAGEDCALLEIVQTSLKDMKLSVTKLMCKTMRLWMVGKVLIDVQ
jgi:hypothetical protein